MDKWNSNVYLKFERERSLPAIDLVNRLDIKTPKKILDIGCGPGNSTKILEDRFKDAEILGVDNSENMINTARETYPNIKWKVCDAKSELNKLDKNYDLVFSNACIQWLPNNKKIIDDMYNLLALNGILAIQIPNNYNEPIHEIIKEVTNSENWSKKFMSYRERYTLEPNEYFDILSEKTTDFEIWEVTYYHEIESYQGILEWYKGTGLNPYLSQLNELDKVEFEKDILIEIEKNYKKQKNGHIILKFPRLFFKARKSE